MNIKQSIELYAKVAKASNFVADAQKFKTLVEPIINYFGKIGAVTIPGHEQNKPGMVVLEALDNIINQQSILGLKNDAILDTWALSAEKLKSLDPSLEKIGLSNGQCDQLINLFNEYAG